MKIKAFALSEGVSYDRMYRAVKWALTQTKRKMGAPNRSNKFSLTEEEMSLCRQYIKGKVQLQKSTNVNYLTQRKAWLETWVAAIREEAPKASKNDGARLIELYSVYACICIAKDRQQLEMELNGARMGDVAVELAYSAGVDYIEAKSPPELWGGFTKFLLDQGYESPGWGII